MEEKVIITGTLGSKVKQIAISAFVLLALSILFFILLSCDIFKYEYTGLWGSKSYYTITGYHAAFEYEDSGSLFLFILAILAISVSLFLFILFLIVRKCSIIITDKNVKGTAIFGKEVVLPLHMVSAYSTRKLFSTIAVATSSGLTKFLIFKNYKEIGNELSRLINERQENTQIAATTINTPIQSSSTLDELKKLKELLDAEIITQEEFENKKKQLLGL